MIPNTESELWLPSPLPISLMSELVAIGNAATDVFSKCPDTSLSAGNVGTSESRFSSPNTASCISLPCLTLSTIRHSFSRLDSFPETKCLSPELVSIAKIEYRDTMLEIIMVAPNPIANQFIGEKIVVIPR